MLGAARHGRTRRSWLRPHATHTNTVLRMFQTALHRSPLNRPIPDERQPTDTVRIPTTSIPSRIAEPPPQRHFVAAARDFVNDQRPRNVGAVYAPAFRLNDPAYRSIVVF
jgi:hypothetical protein